MGEDIIYKINGHYYFNEEIVRGVKKMHPDQKVYKCKIVVIEEVES